ncbi:M15 family metallopeptidase [Streptomyces katsurahamanus]|uniref:M15 family metallopeptidase n=1 Tax=Streptomyces katsurahamanus TaxID=2577098 RepID=A0ABW9NRT7_9ACTN|nr:M15 family metallopeptidase [Streptomyces katsurahamanus]MQS36002.1 M15 family metallopeptidase [Streptomyces katsurahamanus]
MIKTDLSRRRFVGASAGVVGALALTTVGEAAAAPAADPAWSAGRSRNGWQVLRTATSFRIEGSDSTVRLADGDAATVLLHVARRFNYEIDSLRSGDVRGWTDNRKVKAEYESNHLSGTAIAIRPLAYPAGSKGNLYPHELIVVRDILSELDGVVAWGGDFTTPKESHFEIAVKPGHPRLKGVARKIRGWEAGPGNEGAGAIDAFAPKRRSAARAFQRRAA